MRSKEKFTNYDKRKLTYEKPAGNKSDQTKVDHPLSLPPQFQSKIAPNQYKRLKEAFFTEASLDLKLTRAKFPVVVRSLGIVQRTIQLYQVFDELEEKQMKWIDFLQAYIAIRNYKGSYNQLSNAVYDLDKQYVGNWDELFQDLQKYGDILTSHEIQILKKDILKGKTITTQGLINGLLYQR